MGAVTAKSKETLHYRKAVKGTLERCSRCVELRQVSIHAIGGAVIGAGLRCAPIGTGNSRKYGINGNCVCDRFERRAD